MTEFLLKELHVTARYLIVALAAAFITFWVVGHQKPIQGPSNQVSSLAREVNGLQKAFDNYANRKGEAPIYQQPAVTVLKDTGLCGSLTGAQCSQILNGLKPPMQQVASTKLVPPTPEPTPSGQFEKKLYDIDHAATVNALNETTLKTDIKWEPAPLSRAGTMIASGGSGFSYAAVRRQQYELDLGLVMPNNSTHLVGSVGAFGCLKGTALCGGPTVTYNHGLKFGIGLVIH